MQEFGQTIEELNVARVAVERAKDRLEFARSRMARNQLTFQQQLISKQDFDSTKEETALAESDYAEARSELNVLLRGTRSEEIEATRAEIARLEAEKGFLEGQLQRTEVRSPAAGIIATPARQLKEMKGQAVQKGALIAKVYDMKKLTVEIEIPEKEIADIKVGQKVAFRAQAYPDRTFAGVVTSIATTVQSAVQSAESNMPFAGASSSARRTVLVKTEINNDSLLVKPGMTGQAKIFCGPRRIIEIMSRRLIRTVKVEFWSWW
jgi:multidrug resistance efflux pump